MAITSIGYDGTVDETAWTKIMGRAAGNTYGVLAAGDWKVTAHPTLDRGVIVATGVGWGHGVHDTSDASVNLQGATIASGVRWDMVVARRNWAGTGGATTFAMITGTSVKQLPSRTANPGVTDEQPIALVQFSAGSTAPTTIVDLRCWPGTGGMVASDLLVRNYHLGIGSRLCIAGEDWVSTLTSGGAQQWTRQSAVQAVQLFGTSGVGVFGTPPAANATSFLLQSGTAVTFSDGAGYVRLTWPTPFPNGLLSVILTNGASDVDRVLQHVVTLTPAGNPKDIGDKTGVSYSVACEDSTGTNRLAMLGNFQHRVNYIAIGW